ncbi:MAG: hypothetical protein AAB255_00255 [Bacteroidota bacterium]
MKTIFISVVFSLTAFSCNSNPTDENISQSTSSTLVGQWLWRQASGGLTGKVITPSANTRIIISFLADGRYSESRNDTLLVSSNYTIQKGKTIYSTDSLDVIVFQNTDIEKRVIFSITKDSLNVADNYYDGYGFIYTKVNYRR